MKRYQHRSLFDVVAQTGLGLVLISGLLIVLKPFFPDQWVVLFAEWIQSDFDTLAALAVQVLSVLSGIGLVCCLSSLLTHEA